MEIQRAIEIINAMRPLCDCCSIEIFGTCNDEQQQSCGLKNEAIDNAIQALQEQQRRQGEPEPLQCGECKYFDTPEYYGGGTKNVCRLYKRQVQLNDFCSYGERRESEDGK